MTKKTERPAHPRHVLIYDDDWEFLERYFGLGAPRHRRVGCGYMCREYIHQGVEALKQRMRESALEPEPDWDEDEEELVNVE
jgi:hypothetical protein